MLIIHVLVMVIAVEQKVMLKKAETNGKEHFVPKALESGNLMNLIRQTPMNG